MSLATDVSTLTACANDYSADDIFLRTFLALKKENDILFVITTSGKSKNIIKDDDINNIKVRFQKVLELPFKDLRKLIDEGKVPVPEGMTLTKGKANTFKATKPPLRAKKKKKK